MKELLPVVGDRTLARRLVRAGIQGADGARALAHFREHLLSLANRMHPCPPLGQRFVFAAFGLGGKLFAALDGIGGGAKLQFRLAVQFIGLQHIAQ